MVHLLKEEVHMGPEHIPSFKERAISEQALLPFLPSILDWLKTSGKNQPATLPRIVTGFTMGRKVCNSKRASKWNLWWITS